jgi:hypothetical protein
MRRDMANLPPVEPQLEQQRGDNGDGDDDSQQRYLASR